MSNMIKVINEEGTVIRCNVVACQDGIGLQEVNACEADGRAVHVWI